MFRRLAQEFSSKCEYVSSLVNHTMGQYKRYWKAADKAVAAKETPAQHERRQAVEAWLRRVPDEPGAAYSPPASEVITAASVSP